MRDIVRGDAGTDNPSAATTPDQIPRQVPRGVSPTSQASDGGYASDDATSHTLLSSFAALTSDPLFQLVTLEPLEKMQTSNILYYLMPRLIACIRHRHDLQQLLCTLADINADATIGPQILRGLAKQKRLKGLFQNGAQCAEFLSLSTSILSKEQRDIICEIVFEKAHLESMLSCGMDLRALFSLTDTQLAPEYRVMIWNFVKDDPKKLIGRGIDLYHILTLNMIQLTQEQRDSIWERIADKNLPILFANHKTRNRLNALSMQQYPDQQRHRAAQTSNLPYLEQAKCLLMDYCKYTHNGAIGYFSLFFTGHWNRHHLELTNTLILKITHHEITSLSDLIKKMDIPNINNSGDFARCKTKMIQLLETEQKQQQQHDAEYAKKHRIDTPSITIDQLKADSKTASTLFKTYNAQMCAKLTRGRVRLKDENGTPFNLT